MREQIVWFAILVRNPSTGKKRGKREGERERVTVGNIENKAGRQKKNREECGEMGNRKILDTKEKRQG